MDSSRGAAAEGHEGRREQLGRDRKGDGTKMTSHEDTRLTSERPSPTGPKEASRNIGTRYEAREHLFGGRLIALQDMHYADFAEDDVSFAHPMPN